MGRWVHMGPWVRLMGAKMAAGPWPKAGVPGPRPKGWGPRPEAPGPWLQAPGPRAKAHAAIVAPMAHGPGQGAHGRIRRENPTEECIRIYIYVYIYIYRYIYIYIYI